MQAEKQWDIILNQLSEEKKALFFDLNFLCEHIFTINTNGGFHSEYLCYEQNNLKIEKIFKNGVYCGRLDRKYSTFFPKLWGIERVIEEIISAYKNQVESSYTILNSPKIGKSTSGIYIAIETRNGKIKNAYPAPKQESRYYKAKNN